MTDLKPDHRPLNPTPVPEPGAGTSRADLRVRLERFCAEVVPLDAALLIETVNALLGKGRTVTPAALARARARLPAALARCFAGRAAPADCESSPGVTAAARRRQALAALTFDLDGLLAREEVRRSLTDDERRWLLRGMMRTRALDHRLKQLFMSGEVRYQGAGFQGKGFRSLGQEAIFAAGLRLRRGAAWRGAGGAWQGDVAAPLIRDLGLALAFEVRPEDVLRAQMGKAGPPMDGKDLHFGDWDRGVLPAAAPLAISAGTVAGLALAFARRGEPRVAVSCIGEGGSSLGEWHEAINACAARRAPAVFCVQNNQTALSTAVREQSAVRCFADKAAGYGLPGLTVDGTEAEAVACAFAWAADHARAGRGPVLIELVAMRMCGHAHHDDMLYYGVEPRRLGWEYPPLSATGGGYVDRDRWAFWAPRDPLARYAAHLTATGVLPAGEIEAWRTEFEAEMEAAARRVIEAPWPDPAAAGRGVFTDGPERVHVEPLADGGSRITDCGLQSPPRGLAAIRNQKSEIRTLPAPPFTPDGQTYLEAVCRGLGFALARDDRVFVYGQDVGPPYGNAFLLLVPLLERFGGRLLNAPLAESAIVGVLTGAALAGLRPIGEIQFGDFVAGGFNQIVNNAAKIHYRWGRAVPWVLRMPTGGRRRAGPFHSQNTEPWFYRVPGLKIVCPATPFDAFTLLPAAVADDNPVLFYEPIALYRAPQLRQVLPDQPSELPLSACGAARRRAGSDLSLIAYGTALHEALAVAATLAAEDGIEAEVLDLRVLAPLDWDAVAATVAHTHRALIVHEDSVTGGLGQSLAALIQERLFEELDAPVRIVGALDTPVPYAPPLEDAFLPGRARLLRAARLLCGY